MPRQLPWLNKGSGTRTQVKTSTKTAGKRTRRDSDDDDDFFAGTVLERSGKGKGKATAVPFDSDDDLPEAHTGSNRKTLDDTDRVPSSSPPLPESDHPPPPQIESMHKGLSKFNLRDDEWRMVEDEFLATAELFTRHLKAVQYEEIKQKIAKIKTEGGTAEIKRAVVPSANPSVEGSFQRKAKEQKEKQSKGLDDVAKGKVAKPSRAGSAKLASSTLSSSRRSRANSATPRPAPKAIPARHIVLDSDASDGDDLDAPQHPQPIQQKSDFNTHTFVKPVVPVTPRPGPARTTTNLDFDDHPPAKSTSRPPTTHHPSTSRASQPSNTTTTTKTKTSRSLDLFDELDVPQSRDALPKEQTDRLAKRKADREKEEKRREERVKRKAVKLEDIPTFLI
ncbi:hypothetical protein K504DRAFT_485098 [Pleomassaria siparia CBS 279.74]|uniref:Uncharacterized protein n=1 Tax=Pleomassaria siparia CBS 279.74 TaxID=1314801 RepID=A0A6G1JW75_9PLEO|nr:hypothetical protein K504DRAFT_485098 [Pleomassaria siparia CBS 279.74]